MGRGSGGGGRGGSPGRSGGIAANATGGSNRTIAGQKFNTADVVNQALSSGTDDLPGARAALVQMGHTNPSPELVQRYATEARVLRNIERITNSRAGGQIGKWKFTNADTIRQSFESYLNRRVQGQHARWTERTRGR